MKVYHSEILVSMKILKLKVHSLLSNFELPF